MYAQAGGKGGEGEVNKKEKAALPLIDNLAWPYRST